MPWENDSSDTGLETPAPYLPHWKILLTPLKDVTLALF